MNEEIEIEVKNLLGIQPSKSNSVLIYEFDRWSFYEVQSIYPYDTPRKYINFQIKGNTNEKVVIKFTLDFKNEIIKTRYYYLMGTDKEIAEYLIQILIQKIQSRFPIVASSKINLLQV